MARLSYNGSRFTRVDKWDSDFTYKGILLATKLNQKNGQDYKLLDCIDIDWNRTWFKPTGAYISTTENFFDEIEKLDKSKQLTSLTNQVQEIMLSYLTKTEFNEVIGNLQGSLEYGDHLAIRDGNVLYAYDVISNNQLYTFSQSYVSHQYLTSNVYTKSQTSALINDTIDELVGNANSAFDTIHEISDWIMKQSSFIPINYDEIDLSGSQVYYIYDQSQGTYVTVTPNYILGHPNDQYYIINSITTNLDYIIDQLSYINNVRIGNSYWNSLTQSYTYTGLLSVINDLQLSEEKILNDLNDISSTLSDLQIIANQAYQLSQVSYTFVQFSYDMSYYSYHAIGQKGYSAYFKLLTDEDKDNLNIGDEIYSYIPGKGYNQIIYNGLNLLNNSDYYFYIPKVLPSGLYKDISDLNSYVNTAYYAATHSLYNLYISNENNQILSYLELSLTPNSYNGPNRILNVNAINREYENYNVIIPHSDSIIINSPQLVNETSIDKYGNMVINIRNISKDGLVTAYQMNEMITNIISWDMINIEKE